MASIRQTRARNAQDAVDDLIHEVGGQGVSFSVAHDIEKKIIEIVAHFILDIVALRPVHHTPSGDNFEHGLGGFGCIRFHISALRADRGKLFLDRMIKGNGGNIAAKVLRHVIVLWADHLFPRIADDVQKLKLRNPLRPMIVDGLLNLNTIRQIESPLDALKIELRTST
jgi:hypothetical protein